MDEIKEVQNEQEELCIVVDDGAITVPIKNTLGEKVGEFRFHPTDFNIVKRYNKLAEDFGNIIKPLSEANINANGEGSDEKSIDILNKAEKELFEAVNYLFGGNTAEAFFGSVHAFSPVDGKFYCENVINAVGQFIANKFDEEIKQITTRVDKYTHGYRTGKHRNGKK